MSLDLSSKERGSWSVSESQLRYGLDSLVRPRKIVEMGNTIAITAAKAGNTRGSLTAYPSRHPALNSLVCRFPAHSQRLNADAVKQVVDMPVLLFRPSQVSRDSPRERVHR